MGDPMTAQEMRNALEQREKLLDELLTKQNQAGHGVNFPRTQLKSKVDRVVTTGDRLKTDAENYRADIREQSGAANEFMARLRDNDGQIIRDDLIESVTDLEQAVYDHALMLVTAFEGDLNFLRNVSDDHRQAIGILERKSIEDSLSKTQQQLKEKQQQLEEKQAEVGRLEAEVKETKRKYDAAQVSLGESKTKIDALEHDINCMYDQQEITERGSEKLVHDLRTALGVEQYQSSTLSDTLTVFNETLAAKVERDQQDAQSEITSLRTEFQRQIDEKDDSLRDKETAISQLRTDLENKDSRISALDGEMTGKDTKISQLETDLENKDSRISALDGEMEGKGTKISQLETDLKTAKQELKNIQRQASDDKHVDEGLIEDLKRQVIELTQGKEAAEADLATFKEEAKTRIDDLGKELDDTRFAVAKYMATEAKSLVIEPRVWEQLVDSIIRTDYWRPTNSADNVERRIWTVAQPWRAAISLDGPDLSQGLGITNLLVLLCGRVLAGKLDGTSFRLLELLARKSASADEEVLPSNLLRILVEATINKIPPSESLEAELFCLGLLEAICFIEPKWARIPPGAKQLMNMMRSCPSYSMLEELTGGWSGANARKVCQEKGIVQGNVGLIDLRPHAILAVHLADLTLRLVDYDRAGFKDNNHGRLASPSGNDDVVLEILDSSHSTWWFSLPS
ncbi:hypothetical protein F5Y13DRAFT_202690 [Hypoxylon sp. FL1857]|nr:hypothetical protein F5Y13DRAFT_202690 [Hypoxylon sp. FL1857]